MWTLYETSNSSRRSPTFLGFLALVSVSLGVLNLLRGGLPRPGNLGGGDQGGHDASHSRLSPQLLDNLFAPLCAFTP